MYYNYLKSPALSQSMQSVFYGLNKNARIGGGEFADMQNMSGDAYPLLSPRKARIVAQRQLLETEEVTNEDGTTETVETPKTLNGMLGDVGFAAVWDNEFYYMGKKVEGITLADSEKNMLAMGADILIYPDGVYYNTITGEYGDIAKDEKTNNRLYLACYGKFDIAPSTGFACNIYHEWNDRTVTNVTFLSSGHGTNAWVVADCPTSVSLKCTAYNGHSSSHAIIGKKDGFIYYCSAATVTRTKSNGYYTYHYANCKWTKIDIAYFKLTSSQFANLGFTDADMDNIWCGNVKVSIEKDTSGNYLVTNENIADAIALKKIGHYGDTGFSGSHNYDDIGSNLKYEGTWRVRTVPVLDYVCVHENRLWGCRYGMQVSSDDVSETVNEIYCSVLGNFKDWATGTGANNAYTMTVGEYGPFTGCVSHRGQLLFFKENIVYRVSGDKPSNFRIDKISESGLQEGCEKSLEIIDEVLYYKSPSGVYAYDGSIPQKISDALGNFYYTDAVAGKHFSKYYISMVHDGVRKLYVYDTRTGLWHAEAGADVRFFTEYDGALYGAVGNDIVCLSGTPAPFFDATETEGLVEWRVETGDIGLDSPYQKYYHRLLVRMDIELGSRVKIEFSANGGDWLLGCDFTSPQKRSVQIPIATPRCDHMRLRISGIGEARIYSIAYETETVGDVQG